MRLTGNSGHVSLHQSRKYKHLTKFEGMCD